MGEVVGGGFPCVTHVSAFFMGVGGTNVERVKSALVNALADID